MRLKNFFVNQKDLFSLREIHIRIYFGGKKENRNGKLLLLLFVQVILDRGTELNAKKCAQFSWSKTGFTRQYRSALLVILLDLFQLIYNFDNFAVN